MGEACQGTKENFRQGGGLRQAGVLSAGVGVLPPEDGLPKGRILSVIRSLTRKPLLLFIANEEHALNSFFLAITYFPFLCELYFPVPFKNLSSFFSCRVFVPVYSGLAGLVLSRLSEKRDSDQPRQTSCFLSSHSVAAAGLTSFMAYIHTLQTSLQKNRYSSKGFI
jgi:hypothetical protein